jgi:MinD-like ATPase involved in chromosome partitioning or flagellar assembly
VEGGNPQGPRPYVPPRRWEPPRPVQQRTWGPGEEGQIASRRSGEWGERDPDPRTGELTQDDLLKSQRHGDPLLRRLDRRVRSLGSGARDARAMVGVNDRLAQPVTASRRIAVVSIRGGAGKSTVAALVGSALAAHREDRVLLVDADPDLGSLGLRLSAASPVSTRVFGERPPLLADIADAERYLGRTAGRAWILTGGFRSGDRSRLDLTGYRNAMGALARFFAVTVTDAGAGLSNLNQGMLAVSHAVVLVTPATVDGVLSAGEAMQWLAAGPLAPLTRRTTVVLTGLSPESSVVDLDRATRALTGAGAEVVALPFDRHLAVGAAIDPFLLGSTTRSAAMRVAAISLTQAQQI